MAELPEWVRKYKTKGVEIRVSGPNYYAYEMSSKWNPKKKRADKITGEYLGVVTREGIVKPRSIGMVRTDYEYGNIALLHGIADRTIIPVLKGDISHHVGTHHLVCHIEEYTAIAHEIHTLSIREDIPL